MVCDLPSQYGLFLLKCCLAQDCLKCQGQACHGHYLRAEAALQSDGTPMFKPPSRTIKEGFDRLKGKDPTDADVQLLAKVTFLPPEEVRMWYMHLQTIQVNRKEVLRRL